MRLADVNKLIDLAGNSLSYQITFTLLVCSTFMVSSFFQMGYPLIIQYPTIYFKNTKQIQLNRNNYCQNKDLYDIDKSKSTIISSFDLICQNQNVILVLTIGFLFGGFFGSLYSGQIMERKGRRYLIVQSIGLMIIGLVISIISTNLFILTAGFFLFNFAFRGYYNASIIGLSQVSGSTLRQLIPILTHLSWGLGQIIISLIGAMFLSWKFIFIVLIAIPLCFILYGSYMKIYQSPKFLITKDQFCQAKTIIKLIADKNQRYLGQFEIKQETQYKNKFSIYKQLTKQFKQQLTHHSYRSLLKYKSVRVKTLIIAYIWGVISLSYYISTNIKIVKNNSLQFNLGLAGFVQIIGYLLAGHFTLNQERTVTIYNLLLISGIIHCLFYFYNPNQTQTHLVFHVFVIIGQILIRITMSLGNAFLLVYSVQVFTTDIRHYAFGMLGFITKAVYLITIYFHKFWVGRNVHPYLVVGFLLLLGLLWVNKLRETKDKQTSNYVEQNEDGGKQYKVQFQLI